jgi:two-component system, NarL family, response regulator LiaR
MAGQARHSEHMEHDDRPRVIIADDDPLARRAVRDVLQDEGIIVVAEASTGREAVDLAAHYRPDVVLMDMVMPEVDGLQATEQIAERAPGVKVIVLTASDDQELGLLGLQSGALGFLSKRIDLGALPRAVRGVCAGEAAVSRELTAKLVERLQRHHHAGSMRPVRSVLSGREWEVLDLLCDGASTDDVAETLVLSTETVRSHVKNILRKLAVRSRADAIAMARRIR